MTDTVGYSGWIGREAYDDNGDRIGRIDNILYDDTTSRPEWVAVTTGLFGTKTSIAPIAGSTEFDGGLRLACTKDQVKDAPRCEVDTILTDDEERALYTHYGYSHDSTEQFGPPERADMGYAVTSQEMSAPRLVAEEEAGGDEMVARTEIPRIDKDVVERRTRLRKYRITEMVEVPVTREEIRVETDTGETTVVSEDPPSTR